MLAAAGCGSRVVAGDQPDAIVAVEEDASANQRGPLDAAPDGSQADLVDGGGSPATDAGAETAGPRDADSADLVVKVDAPARACSAQALRCNGKSPERCSADGVWQTAGTACQYLCRDGLCAGDCLPGSYQCAGTIRQRCDDNAKWADNLACPFVCTGTDCGGVCLPGRNRCLAGDLQSCSTAGAWQSVGTAARELLANPGFDEPDLIWSNPGIHIIYVANGSGANNTPDVAAQSPTNLAWFGGVNRSDARLLQSVTIPAGAASVTLSFYYAIISNESGADENDVFDAAMVSEGGEVTPLAHLSDNNTTDTWVQFKAAVPAALFGQTVTLELHGSTNATQVTSFYVDTVSLTAVACP